MHFFLADKRVTCTPSVGLWLNQCIYDFCPKFMDFSKDYHNNKALHTTYFVLLIMNNLFRFLLD